MTEGVIQIFKMIDVDHQNAESRLLAGCPSQLPIKRFLHVTSIEQAGQRVSYRLYLQRVAHIQICQSKSRLLRECTRETLLRNDVLGCPSAAYTVQSWVDVQQSQGFAVCRHRYTHG